MIGFPFIRSRSVTGSLPHKESPTTESSRESQASISMCRSRWTRVLLCLWLTAVLEKNTASARASTSACVKAAPRLLLQDQREQLCRLIADQGDTAPALCASTALRATNAFPAKTQQQRAEMVIQLCERANDTGPASCWLTFQYQLRQQDDLTSTLLSICQDAHDTKTAECFLKWRKLTAYTPKHLVLGSTPSIAHLCKGFQGDVEALATCVEQVPHALGPLLRFEMCRYAVSMDRIPAISACGAELTSRNVPAKIVSQVCARTSENESPQECAIAATQQLRWMDENSTAYLCESSSSAEPVDCAVQLRRKLDNVLAADDPGSSSASSVAQLCHQTRNASLVVSCVSKMPLRSFNLFQLSRLCASSASTESDLNSPVHATQCVVRAKELFGFFTFSEIKREAVGLIFELCQDATSDAPIACMVSVQHEQTLSKQQRVQLCSKAESTNPQECYSSLRHLIHSKKISVGDALALCEQARSLAPAQCIAELTKFASTSFMEHFAAVLCDKANSSAPALCYQNAPSAFPDHAKAILCQHATSAAPAKCAQNPVTRMSTAMEKAQLCHRAESTPPAACAISAPFGMKANDILALCRFASSDQPARCARSISVSSQVSWQMIAELCAGAVSTTPAHCLSHHIRQRGMITRAIVSDCRLAVPTPTSLEIAQVSYKCRELVPNCLISIHLRLHDQFGEDMLAWTGGYLHVAAKPTDDTDVESERVLHGQSHAPIVNGSAIFRDMSFIEAGNFIITFGSSSASSHVEVAAKIARIRIHEDRQERLRMRRCKALFACLECAATALPELVDMDVASTNATEHFQYLELSNRYYLDALGCRSYWQEHAGGLQLQGATSTRFVFAINRAAYHFLTYVSQIIAFALSQHSSLRHQSHKRLTHHSLVSPHSDMSVPSANMSAWACLGLAEGANRSQIRRAYHRKSLEWHPDKWSSAGTVSLHARVTQIYALITHAYNDLFHAAGAGAADGGTTTSSSSHRP